MNYPSFVVHNMNLPLSYDIFNMRAQLYRKYWSLLLYTIWTFHSVMIYFIWGPNITGNIDISKTPSMFPPLHGFPKKLPVVGTVPFHWHLGRSCLIRATIPSLWDGGGGLFQGTMLWSQGGVVLFGARRICRRQGRFQWNWVLYDWTLFLRSQQFLVVEWVLQGSCFLHVWLAWVIFH